jgi:hypothetical protein
LGPCKRTVGVLKKLLPFQIKYYLWENVEYGLDLKSFLTVNLNCLKYLESTKVSGSKVLQSAKQFLIE